MFFSGGGPLAWGRGLPENSTVGHIIRAGTAPLIDSATRPRGDRPPRLLEAVRLGRRHPDGRKWLLRDVSVCLRPGDRAALVGATGSGKTLLLRALVLLDRVDTGQVLWRGETPRPDEIPAFRRQVALVHQRPVMFPGTVEENLRIPFALRACRHLRFDRQEILRQLHAIGRAETFLGQPCDNLSGGEQQIVALLRSLQLAPDVLLLDEPTAALDAGTAEAVEALVAAWYAGDPAARATLWVTHDRVQAERIGRRLITMAGGVVTERG